MPRTKERIKILHNPSTQEIFQCLQGNIIYSRILAESGPQKPFHDFLSKLIDVGFFDNMTEKISVKRIASELGTIPTKATKWLKEIYEDIFELNCDRPELFQKNGIAITMYIRSYDNYCSFATAMPVLPREYEKVRFPFVHAKIGIDYFWVKKLEYELVNGETIVSIWLEGGFLNRYREFTLDKALFQGQISFIDVHQKMSFELDEEIKKLYRN